MVNIAPELNSKGSNMGLWAAIRTDPSSQALLFANIATICFAIFFSWSVFEVMLIYWVQSIIIGIFAILKMISAGVWQRNPLPIFLVPFFVLHYGGFHSAYLIAISALFLPEQTSISFGLMLGVALGAAVYFLNHLVSFILRFSEVKTTSPETFFISPYQRIIPMHISIIFGGFIFIFSGSNLIVLIFFMLLKTLADISMHIAEHK
jgi:hypothetical protein